MKFWDQSDEYNSHSLRCVKQVSEKKKEKILVKIPPQLSLYAVKFEDRSQEETDWKTRAMRPRQLMEACQRNLHAQRKRQRYILFAYQPTNEWIMTAASTIKPEEREFVVDSWASIHMVSKRDLNSAELETMRTSKNPTTVMTANGEVQTREGATVYVKELDLFVTVILLWRNTRSSFTREALRGSWVHLPLDQWSKTTSHQKKTKESIEM